MAVYLYTVSKPLYYMSDAIFSILGDKSDIFLSVEELIPLNVITHNGAPKLGQIS